MITWGCGSTYLVRSSDKSTQTNQIFPFYLPFESSQNTESLSARLFLKLLFANLRSNGNSSSAIVWFCSAFASSLFHMVLLSFFVLLIKKLFLHLFKRSFVCILGMKGRICMWKGCVNSNLIGKGETMLRKCQLSISKYVSW